MGDLINQEGFGIFWFSGKTPALPLRSSPFDFTGSKSLPVGLEQGLSESGAQGEAMGDLFIGQSVQLSGIVQQGIITDFIPGGLLVEVAQQAPFPHPGIVAPGPPDEIGLSLLEAPFHKIVKGYCSVHKTDGLAVEDHLKSLRRQSIPQLHIFVSEAEVRVEHAVLGQHTFLARGPTAPKKGKIQELAVPDLGVTEQQTSFMGDEMHQGGDF